MGVKRVAKGRKAEKSKTGEESPRKASGGRGNPHKLFHKDGSLWAKGVMLGGKMHGYWEWFRKGGGALMRSGYFEEGEQVGEWITYDREGKVFKVTQMKGTRK